MRPLWRITAASRPEDPSPGALQTLYKDRRGRCTVAARTLTSADTQVSMVFMPRIHPAGRVTAPVRPVFLGLGLTQPLLQVSCRLFGSPLSPQPTPDGWRGVRFQGELWQDEVIYFALTDRFSNGDTSNDNGADRSAADRADRQNPLGWHGRDWEGIQQKIKAGFFKSSRPRRCG